jgi:hypothetical protein
VPPCLNQQAAALALADLERLFDVSSPDFSVVYRARLAATVSIALTSSFLGTLLALEPLHLVWTPFW